MTRMDLTGPWATCIHVTSFTQDKYVGSQDKICGHDPVSNLRSIKVLLNESL